MFDRPGIRQAVKAAALALLVAAGCQGPEAYFRGPEDGGGFDGLPPLGGQSGTGAVGTAARAA